MTIPPLDHLYSGNSGTGSSFMRAAYRSRYRRAFSGLGPCRVPASLLAHVPTTSGLTLSCGRSSPCAIAGLSRGVQRDTSPVAQDYTSDSAISPHLLESCSAAGCTRAAAPGRQPISRATLNVSVMVSSNGGSSYTIAASSFESGSAVGSNVSRGTGKHRVWADHLCRNRLYQHHPICVCTRSQAKFAPR